MNIEKINQKEEEMKNENTKTLTSIWKGIFYIISVSFIIFHIYTAFSGNFVTQTSIHFLFALTLAFLIYPWSKKGNSKISALMNKIDVVFAIMAVTVNVYYIYHADRIILQMGFLNPTSTDKVMAVITILLAFEAARRALGLVFPLLAVIASLYAIFGSYLVNIPFMSGFAHRGYTLEQFAIEMFMGQRGIFQGTLLSVGATTIAIFIIFGAMLVLSGGGEHFIKLALAIAGRLKGGPAKVSILGSALFGSINGSTAANTATTGVFTIPLMKKNGYKPHFAGGVESAASCGGQILPPIMGAAAFVLAEVTNTSYLLVAAAAIIPALLYYFSLWMAVDLEAKRLGLQPIEQKDMPKLKEVLFSSKSPALFVPMFVLIGLLVSGYTPTMSAFGAVATSLILFFIQSIIAKEGKGAIKKFIVACGDGARTVTLIAVILSVAQIIATVISLTGIGNKISNALVSNGDMSLLLTLFIGMVVTILMGMGVPTVAAYMLAASVIYPAFAALGFPILASHLFILYYAILSGITPPVALAAYVAGSISGSHWFRTAITACKIGLAGFLIPYMFLFNPALLGQGPPLVVTVAVITAIFGIIALAGSTIGYLITHVNWLNRLILFAVAILLIHPALLTDLIGFLFLIVVVAFQWYGSKKDNNHNNNITKAVS